MRGLLRSSPSEHLAASPATLAPSAGSSSARARRDATRPRGQEGVPTCARTLSGGAARLQFPRSASSLSFGPAVGRARSSTPRIRTTELTLSRGMWPRGAVLAEAARQANESAPQVSASHLRIATEHAVHQQRRRKRTSALQQQQGRRHVTPSSQPLSQTPAPAVAQWIDGTSDRSGCNTRTNCACWSSLHLSEAAATVGPPPSMAQRSSLRSDAIVLVRIVRLPTRACGLLLPYGFKRQRAPCCS
jgi:hypothetical protein